MSDGDAELLGQEMRVHGWIFPWRRNDRRRWTMVLAVILVTPMMFFLLSLVQVRVFFTPPALNRSAELVLVPATDEHRAWLEAMAQKTPFPGLVQERLVESRSDAYLLSELGDGFQPGQQLRDVWVPENPTIFSDDAWYPPLPILAELPTSATAAEKGWWQPRVRWLSFLPSDKQPLDWPVFPGSMKAGLGAKLMIEVDAQGRVVSCLPASKEPIEGWTEVENWLKRLRFPAAATPLGWLAGEIVWEVADD